MRREDWNYFYTRFCKQMKNIITEYIPKQKLQKVIALDKLFKGNDPLKTNTVLQMKDLGIEFKTI